MVEGKIREFQTEIAIKIEGSAEAPPITVKSPEATFPGDVVESEDTEVTLTAEQLKELAAGKGL